MGALGFLSSHVQTALRRFLIDSEPVKWAVQNSLGLVVCLLFVLVPQLRYSGSCSATVFYAVSALFFSLDRSVGGRTFGGVLWIAVFLSGGLLGFALVSLAWLARGAGVPLEGLSDTTVDPSTIPEISSWFYIIIILGHLLLGTILTWTRATAIGLDVALALIGQIFVSEMAVLGVGFLPFRGQTWLWTDSYGSFLKNGLVVCLALFVNSSFVYVHSAHDDVRETISACFFDLSELYSRISSDLNAVAHGITKGSLSEAPVPTSISIMRKTLLSQSSMMAATMEPAIPGVFCSSSDDSQRFALLIQKLQVHLGSVRSVEKITRTLIDGISGIGQLPRPLQTRVISTAALITAKLAGLASEMGHPLRVQRRGCEWKPHDLMFWDSVMGKMADCIDTVADDLHISAAKGLERALEEELDGPVTDVRGVGVALLATLESLIDEVIGLEVVVASALGVDAAELSVLISPPTAVKPWYRYRWLSGFITDVTMASGIHVWVMEFKQLYNVIRHLKARVLRESIGKSPALGDKQDIVKLSQRRRQVRLFWKVYIGYQLSFIAVVLITWLRFSSTGNYKDNAAGAAKFVGNWYPEYFFFAVAVCSQDTVDASVYKAILRVVLIALGGGVAIAAAANESLMSSPWYVFWIALLVNFAASLPAVVSFDFRYSLFLFAYTFNGIFVCSYEKTFSDALQVYAGKSVSTALGAIFAVVVSNIVLPTYVSETAAEFEAALLQSHTDALIKSFRKGRAWSAREGAPAELWCPDLPRLGYKSDDHAELNRDLLLATSSRLGIVKSLFTEVETKSLDGHFMFFVKITLLPLPPSLKLVFADIGAIGMFTNLSLRVLRSSFLRGSTGNYSSKLGQLFDQTEALFEVAQGVAEAVRVVLVRPTVQSEDIEDLKSKVLAIQVERSKLASMFRGLALSGKFTKGDIRTAVWYIVMLRGVKELAGLGKRLSEREDYQTKLQQWTFRAELPN